MSKGQLKDIRGNGDKKRKKLTYLAEVHNMDNKGIPRSINRLGLVRYVLKHYHMLNIEGKLWLYSGGVYEIDDSGDKVKRIYQSYIYEKLVDGRLLADLHQMTLINAEKKSINHLPEHSGDVINFNNGMYDYMTGEISQHYPTYYSINQIPHDLDTTILEQQINTPLTANEMPTFFKFFETTIPDAEDRAMVYDFMALCFTTVTEGQQFLQIAGDGGTGKSTILELVEKLVGFQNISNLPLQKLEERFQSIALLGKIVNICADMPITPLKDSSTLKRITGQDFFDAEYKGGKTFKARSNAKLLTSTNKIIVNLGDKSNAFYRRMIPIYIKQKGEHIDNLKANLEIEIPFIIVFLVSRLKPLAQNGYKIKLSDNARTIISQLKHSVDTVQAFVDLCTVKNDEHRIKRNVVYNKYIDYCELWHVKNVYGRTNFYRAIEEKGYSTKKINGTYYFEGFELTLNIPT